MTEKELEILTSPQARQAIARNAGKDPVSVALDRNIGNAALIATQVKYLARAKDKLPSYYEAMCIIPPLAFEQSSGERTARYKAENYNGDLCIDLTCGLGVDSYCLSHSFKNVIAAERDPVLARVAQVNFRLLGRTNIDVRSCTAEELVAQMQEDGAPVADMVYVDPARRDTAGRKVAGLADCSPDIGKLMPALRKIARKVVIKLSPMFDTDEAFRIFGDNVKVEVISVGGECKEVVVEADRSIATPVIKATAIGKGSVEYLKPEAGMRSADSHADMAAINPGGTGVFGTLSVPDVALSKARMAARYFSEMGARIESDNSFAFFATPPRHDVIGRIYNVLSREEFNPKRLKKELKARGIVRMNIMRRDFPLAAADIARQLGIREGGDRYAAFYRMDGALWMSMLETR